MLASAELVVADGMPLVWASRVAGTPLPERVAGSSMTVTLAAAAAAAGRSLFLLGGNTGVAEEAAEALRATHPDIRIAGTWCPPMGFEHDAVQMDKIRKSLAASNADLVLVALGSPKQERLIRDLRAEGLLPSAWWIGVGISLSFLTGEVQRAPRWMQAAGLEWTHRLVQEPRRLVKRYLLHGIPFGLGLMGSSLAQRLRRRV